MKKGVAIIFVIAALGGASFYIKDQNNSAQTKVATPSTTSSQSSQASSTKYKDGTYNGKAAETPYGTVQIAAIITSGKVSDIKFLKMPSSDDRSVDITKEATPKLKQAAIDAQSADIDFITGATSTSYGYQESLQAALDKAKVS